MTKSNKLVDISAPSIVGPEGPYRCIYLDPPWPERGGGKIKRGADRHYDTLSVREIEHTVLHTLGVNVMGDPGDCHNGTVLAPAAHCWMWVTDNYLEAGLDLMRMMGFKYKRTLVWCKTSPGNIEQFAVRQATRVVEEYRPHVAGTVKWARSAASRDMVNAVGEWIHGNPPKGGPIRSGLGQYARGSHELLLFGSRGKAHMPPTEVRPKSVQFAPITEHSAKPELFYDIIEACSPGPRLEMFARNARPGWAVFGNEVE